MSDFNENNVTNNEVAEQQEVETVEVYDETTGKWTRGEKIGTGLVLGTSVVGTGFILYKVGKPVVAGTKKVCKKAWNGLKGLFGKKEEPVEEPVEEEKPKPKKKASKKKESKTVEPTEK